MLSWPRNTARINPKSQQVKWLKTDRIVQKEGRPAHTDAIKAALPQGPLKQSSVFSLNLRVRKQIREVRKQMSEVAVMLLCS